jgi:DNA adenine methylase
MRYLGGKTNLGKEISDILEKLCPPNTVNGYIEPFCGALGVMSHMTSKGYKKYLSYDLCEDLIILWQELKNNTFVYPKKINEKLWNKYKFAEPSSARAFFGFGLSFGGKWFSTYIGNYSDIDKEVKQTKNSLEKMKVRIKNVSFVRSDYKNIKPKNMLIYCDPPYKDTMTYKAVNNFDSDEFWKIIRIWSKHNTVVVSEFSAPKDFKCIWKKKRKININKVTGHNVYRYEKLYMFTS